MSRYLVISAFALACITSLSCKVNPYCLNCETGDGGGDDGGPPGDGSDGGAGNDADASNCIPDNPPDEKCDGKDNDCDGKIDEDVPEVGQPCSNQAGECAGGTITCGSGKLGCTKNPAPEICDNKDNDCNGTIDDNNPLVDKNGNPQPAKCGNGVGECRQGDNKCQNGNIVCVGAVGSSAEICDGKDNDCDGTIDNGLTNMGSCGNPPLDCGGNPCPPCSLGTLSCIGGTPQCIGEVDPTIELCDGIDNDCDGTPDNGFNLNTDPQNCGACNHVCSFPHAVADCVSKVCGIQTCLPGFFDVDGQLADGCEYACNLTGTEVCDGKDNNCNGQTDENLTPPPICATKGACAGTTATCDGAAGFECHYPSPPVQLDGNGNLVAQETLCDGIDNDCDGITDEGTPNLGQPCFSGTCKLTGGDCFQQSDCSGAGNTCLFAGRCGGKGVFVCDSDPTKPAKCQVTTHGQKPIAEACNNQDDDCDGVIDNGGSTGSLVGQNWVDIGNNIQMMQFEASKPDADGTTDGNVTNGTVCSKAGSLPWTNIKYPDAVAACSSVGARLCNEQEWHRTCSVVAPTSYPISLASSGTVLSVVQAEDYFSLTNATDAAGNAHTWIEDYEAPNNNGPGFTGISDLLSVPNTGANLDNTNVRTQAPRLDYQIKVNKTSNYTIWVLISALNNNDNRVWVNIDNASMGASADNSFRISAAAVSAGFVWLNATHSFALTAGTTHTINVYMGRDGVRIDAVAITDGATAPAEPTDGQGHHWAYSPASAADTYNPGTCNGHDFSAANDNILPTGAEASCFATTGTGVFDMSGNVKEWTLAHLSNQNPIRGGASNNDDQGISCPLNFTLADDTFFFPNVGFRCCRTHP